MGALELRPAPSADRRHQHRAAVRPNRPWLNGGGTWAALLRDWRVTTTFTWQSGTPLTPRVLARSSDVARGTNGTLRADYNGDRIQLADPTIDRVLQHLGVLDPADRHVRQRRPQHDHRPGQPPLNAQFSRDVRMGGNRAVTLQLNAIEPAEHGELRRRRHGRELADVRPGPLGAADALDAVQSEIQVLVRFRRVLSAAVQRCSRLAGIQTE